MAHQKRQGSAREMQAAHLVLWGFLPQLVSGNEHYTAEKRRLETLYRCLPVDIPNFGGIEYYVESWEELPDSPVRQNRMASMKNVKAYVSAIQSLADRLRLGESYGPELIHRLVQGPVTFGDDRFQAPLTISTPVRLTLEITIDGMTPYGVWEPDGLNPLAKYYPDGEPSPQAAEHSRLLQGSDDAPDGLLLSLTARDLPDLQRAFAAVLRWLEDESGLRSRKVRSEAYRNLKRDTERFYLNRCEGRSPHTIADDEKDADGLPDASMIHKSIARVQGLLSLLRVV